MAPQSALRTASIRTKRARNETYTRRKLLEESTSPGLQKTSLAPQRCPRPKAPSSPVKERAHPAPPPASPTSTAARTAPVGHNASRHACTRASVCCAKNRKLERANDQRTASAEQPRPSMAKVGPSPSEPEAWPKRTTVKMRSLELRNPWYGT